MPSDLLDQVLHLTLIAMFGSLLGLGDESSRFVQMFLDLRLQFR